MQVYFVSATYTNNVYKLSDFYDGSNYRLNLDKMLDINLKADDGIASFITKHIELPDETSVRDHTHIIVPELSKIYKISSIDYNNISQYTIILDEDPLIANYQTLKDRDIILTRTNDQDLFRGINDIADMTFKPTITTKTIESQFKTGKWALLFFQVDPDASYIALNFLNTYEDTYESFASLTALKSAYPEVSTSEPSKYEYFQKIAYLPSEPIFYRLFQCVYYNGALKWVLFKPNFLFGQVNTVYIKNDTLVPKISSADVKTLCIALPFESDLYASTSADANRLFNYESFLGPVSSGQLIDIKVIDGHLLPASTMTFSLSGNDLRKVVTPISGSAQAGNMYSDSDLTTLITGKIGFVYRFVDDIDVSYESIYEPDLPYQAEPFYKYDLYVFGRKFVIPYYMRKEVGVKFAVNSGVINYIVYYQEIRNILGSGSFTHSIKYQVDQLDAFYNQNPTYKEQFFTKLGIDAMKGVIGGAIGGSVVPGIGTAVGAVGGLISSGVDAGVSMLNLHYMEKGLKLKPEQIFGENSEVTMQLKNIFGIYWVKTSSENNALMQVEYAMKGFPTSLYTSIDDLSYHYTIVFGSLTKIVYGELKTIIRNNYVTGFINQKLKEGIILIP